MTLFFWCFDILLRTKSQATNQEHSRTKLIIYIRTIFIEGKDFVPLYSIVSRPVLECILCPVQWSWGRVGFGVLPMGIKLLRHDTDDISPPSDNFTLYRYLMFVYRTKANVLHRWNVQCCYHQVDHAHSQHLMPERSHFVQKNGYFLKVVICGIIAHKINEYLI
jgi:hypothetical protein